MDLQWANGERDALRTGLGVHPAKTMLACLEA
jgi:hypothetical protein